MKTLSNLQSSVIDWDGIGDRKETDGEIKKTWK